MAERTYAFRVLQLFQRSLLAHSPVAVVVGGKLRARVVACLWCLEPGQEHTSLRLLVRYPTLVRKVGNFALPDRNHTYCRFAGLRRSSSTATACWFAWSARRVP